MNLRDMMNEFVEINNFLPNQVIDFDQYLLMHENAAPILSGAHRGLQALISVSAWTTSDNGIQHLVYLPMSTRQEHCAKIHFPDGIMCTPHTHDYVELIYIIEGTLSMQINGKSYTIQSGEICLVNTEATHSEYLYAQNTTVICLGIDDIFFDQYDLSSKSQDYTSSLKKLINQKRAEYLYILFSPIGQIATRTAVTFELVMQELMDDLPGKKRLLIGYVERIVDLLTKEYHIRIAQVDKQALYTAIIEAICEYIQSNLPKVTVHDVSEKFNYNPDYLNRLFKKGKGMNISNYIQECRMHLAIELLISTDLSIELISHQVGYHNLGFFYQKFKEFYDTTPQGIRENIRGTLRIDDTYS